jgi:hypothetical protein
MRPATDGGNRTRVARRIAADPSSTALLLAGPSALELWPGVTRVATLGDADQRVLVDAVLPADLPQQRRSTAATVRVLPPRRTPTSYVLAFDWSGPVLPLTTGELALSYAPGSESGPSTLAVLTLDSSRLLDSALSPPALTALAEAFLANLAALAESRSSAA